MVYATCYCPVSQKNVVDELGFAGKFLLEFWHFVAGKVV